MGAKQSKRSVDISGKEAESAGEVAAAGAGGEGRVEPIADADALKPTLNGAHIQPPQEISDKEKQLDSGTPENEKDATTEKEGKEEQSEEKETTPVTNGDSEPKEENGESVPTPEDGKKPKKEKVKKKWSLRSISFSRKDKPKQEKKSKEEEPKTNGEPEKVPEEAAEATAEPVDNKVADAAQVSAEVKEEKTPETPVTEPMTNGSSTPESPKVETLATDESPAAPAPVPQEPAAPETKPEQLPLNGLSLDEPKKEVPEETPVEESKAEEPTVVTTETVPAPEIPVRTEVCDAQIPLIEPTPPPLPANPPPSSVASFAATTMAPELIEASLANTAENAILTPSAIPDITADKPDEINSDTQTVTITNLAVTELSPPLKEVVNEDTPVPATTETDITQANIESVTSNNISESISNAPEIDIKIESEPEKVSVVSENETLKKEHVEESFETPVEKSEANELENKITDPASTADANTEAVAVSNMNGNESVETQSPVADSIDALEKDASIDSCTDVDQTPAPASDVQTAEDELPPPPPPEDECRSGDEPIIDNSETALKENIVNDNHIVDTDTNGVIDETEQKNLKNKNVDALGNIVDVHECNGNGDSVPEVSPPSSPAQPASAASDASDSLPPPPGELCRAPSPSSPAPSPPPPPQPEPAGEPHVQDPLPIADKIADLIPEIPTIPELKTETETSSEVAVAD